jgi:glyoxylase-like metal-dependent hydrolase (beta-lactamase superfamily II)
MHPAERETLALLRAQGADMAAGDRAWLRLCGVPDDVAAELSMRSGNGHPFAGMVDPDRLLEHGDLVPLAGRQLRAVWTPGHTPGHLCLHDETENLLLTGDHVLPRISPNIGLQPHAAEPPLAAYLRSLESVAAYDSAEALPAHEYRFHGLASRVRMLLAHHERRCDEVIEILRRRGPSTTWQVTTELTWSRGWAAVTGFMRRAALAKRALISASRRQRPDYHAKAGRTASDLPSHAVAPAKQTARGSQVYAVPDHFGITIGSL